MCLVHSECSAVFAVLTRGKSRGLRPLLKMKMILPSFSFTVYTEILATSYGIYFEF